MEDIISHVADKEQTLKLFSNEHRHKLGQFAREFCYNFKTKIGIPSFKNADYDVNNRPMYVYVFTSEGLPCGQLGIGVHGGEDFYMFKSPTISKEKASARAERDTRDSSTVKGLINAIKRNKEEPTAEKVLSTYAYGIKCALESTSDGPSNVLINLDRVAATELVKSYLGETNGASGFDTQIREAYKQYLEQLEKSEQAMVTYKRFAEGCKVVGILSIDNAFKPIYLVGESDFGIKENYHSVKNFSVVKSLSDDPRVAADAMMIRTYMQGNSRMEKSNEMYFGHSDYYYNEIDVATGYNRYDNLWVLIPNRGE